LKDTVPILATSFPSKFIVAFLVLSSFYAIYYQTHCKARVKIQGVRRGLGMGLEGRRNIVTAVKRSSCFGICHCHFCLAEATNLATNSMKKESPFSENTPQNVQWESGAQSSPFSKSMFF
jgi:hypothetical protein